MESKTSHEILYMESWMEARKKFICMLLCGGEWQVWPDTDQGWDIDDKDESRC